MNYKPDGHPVMKDKKAVSSSIREVIPFFLVVTVVMIGLYVAALAGLGNLRTPTRIAWLSVLMVLHLALYWSLLILPERLSTYLLFLVVQCGLAYGLTTLIHQPMLALGIYAPLVGVAVGALRSFWRSTAAVIAILALATFNVFQLQGVQVQADWFWILIPMVLFVIVYVELYSRQSEAREESQRLFRELEIAHGQLAEYAAQVEDLTLANERQRIARELHDTLAQGLVGLTLQLEAATFDLKNKNVEHAQEILQQAMARSRATLADARRAISDLREKQAEPVNLGDIIQMEADRFSSATGIPCTVHTVRVDNMEERTAEHIQRIVAEALLNIARHASAGSAAVQMAVNHAAITISIRDDGCGFDAQTDIAKDGHYGVLGMRERARLAGGSLTITSQLGQGTTVSCTLPRSGNLKAGA